MLTLTMHNSALISEKIHTEEEKTKNNYPNRIYAFSIICLRFKNYTEAVFCAQDLLQLPRD